MSQIVTKFIKDLAILSGSSAAHGKIGSGAATATQALFSDGAGGTSFRSILSTDIPTLNQNTTGTASNITATSNSTLTTLSALTTANSLTSATSLAISGSQVSGGTFGAVNGSALTNLSAAALSGVLPVGVTGGSGLSIATSQLTGTVSLTTQVSGILPVANGGTGDSSFTANQVVIGGTASTNPLAQVAAGTSGQVLTSNGSAAPTWQTATAGANTALSNLVAPTAINQDLLPAADSTQSLGNASNAWQNVFTDFIFGEPTVNELGTGSPTWPGSTINGTNQLVNANFNPSGPLSPDNITPGLLISGEGIPSGTYVVSFDGNSTVTMSQNATETATVTISFWNPIPEINVTAGTLIDAGVLLGDQVESLPVTSIDWVNRNLDDSTGTTQLNWNTTNASSVLGVGFPQLTASKVPYLDANKVLVSSAITPTQLGYLSGASGTTGTGNIVFSTSPTLVTPALGTPSAIVLTNATALPLTTGVTGILPVANGGTGDSSFTANQVVIGGTTTTNPLAQVAAGTSGQVLTSNGSAAPTWATPATGSVTSVGFADTSTIPIYTITNSPVTSSGTIDQTLNTQTANTVFSGPTSGSAAQPTFRSLVIADLTFAGAANGVATLDGSGKVPLSQLPSTLMEFKGNWNPNTNTPTLVDGTGTTGFTYWVSATDTGTVAGLTDPSMVNFQVGDLVIYNGTKWVLTTPAAGVSFVNGSQGAVVMTMASANGFAGTYSGTALTVSTTLTTPVVAANGTALIAATTTGTGSTVVLSTSPTLVTPALGTPSAIVLTNATALPLTTGVTGILPIANGGTNASTAAAAFNNLSPMTTTGDMIYEASASTAARLPIGTTGQVLTVVGGIPTWSATSATMTPGKDTVVLSSTDITNQFITLSHTPIANSTDLLIQGAGDQLEGASYDYTVSGATIVFQNGLATGGASALVAGDILQVAYMY